MNRAEQYALKLAADAIESVAEDDLDEDGVFPAPFERQGAHPEGLDEGLHPEHRAAIDLAMQLTEWLRENGHMILAELRGDHRCWGCGEPQ